MFDRIALFIYTEVFDYGINSKAVDKDYFFSMILRNKSCFRTSQEEAMAFLTHVPADCLMMSC